jgi:hypothetical protein
MKNFREKTKNINSLFHFQGSSKKSYAFEYSVNDESTGFTHSRKESSDENGVVRGAYEVLEPGCIIRRVEYQADHYGGFQILGITKRFCANPVNLPKPPYLVEASATILPPAPPAPPPKWTQRPSYKERKRQFSPTVAPYSNSYLPPPPPTPTNNRQQGKTPIFLQFLNFPPYFSPFGVNRAHT